MKSNNASAITIMSTAFCFGIYAVLSWIFWYLITFRHWDLQANVALFPLANIATFGSIFCVSLYGIIRETNERMDRCQKRIEELEELVRKK